MIASSLPPPGAVSFDHQKISSVPLLAPAYFTFTLGVHVLEINHSLLPDHAFGIIFLHMSVS